MSKVFVSMTMSLDGFVAPETRADDPKHWMTEWMKLQSWVFGQQFFRDNLHLGKGGEEGPDNDYLRRTFERTGVSVMGKRMFDAGEHSWPEDAPFHTPVFVVTHEKRDPWPRKGGTTFYFVDGIVRALANAREVARDRDIRVSGGANLVQQCLRAGLVDELELAVPPVCLGTGIRLLEDVGGLKLKIRSSESSAAVTRLAYARG